MKPNKKKSTFKKWLSRVWIAGGLIFMVWQWSTFQARNLPEDTFKNTGEVEVIEEDDFYFFKSKTSNLDYQVVFLQGALADPEAYGPLCKSIAENGFDTQLIKADFRLPIHFKDEIIDIVKQSEKPVVIGGHSQGAKISSELVQEHPDLFEGLFLLGTSHPRDFSLTGINIPALKLYAEHDGLASVQEVEENNNRLPAGTEMILIEGGNHSQFGYLGNLFMDDKATISLEKQQKITESQVLRFLKNIVKNGN